MALVILFSVGTPSLIRPPTAWVEKCPSLLKLVFVNFFVILYSVFISCSSAVSSAHYSLINFLLSHLACLLTDLFSS